MTENRPPEPDGDSPPLVMIRVDVAISERDARFLEEMVWTMGITRDEAIGLCLEAGIRHYRRCAPRLAGD